MQDTQEPRMLSSSRLRRLAPWLAAALLYALFRLWYDGFSAPLSPAEVDGYVARMAERGFPAERIALIRKFLSEDTGGDFVMVNFIELVDAPEPVGDMKPGESGRAVLDRYMAYMTPALLGRASHPILGGDAAASAIETWGLPGAERWSMAGVVRYRSRRDMIEIASDPRFRDAHLYKLAAMAKTIAVPIDPYFGAGGPRVAVALALIAAAALAHAALARRSAA
jgi:hypothetical protein